MTGPLSSDPAVTDASCHPSAPVARMLGELAAAGLDPRARVLALGGGVQPLAAALRASGHEVVEARGADAEALLGTVAREAPGSFGAVLALGFVERQRWDRWALQRIRHALAADGVLALAVPDLLSPRSFAEPRELAARVAGRIPFLARLAARRGPARSTDGGGRAYPRSRLRAMLESVGLEPRRWTALAASDGGRFAGVARWLPSHHLVLARAGPGSVEATAAVADRAGLARRIDPAHRRFLAARDRWRREHAPGEGEPRELDPAGLAGGRVLVLSPHPDDEIIGCGGTLLRLVRAGARVTVVQATDGSASAALADAPPSLRREVRLAEARTVAARAGFEATEFWREDNADFRVREVLVTRLRDTVRRLAPRLILTPFLTDIHPDHRTLNRILAASLEGCSDDGPTIVGYEVWGLAPANLWCDVTECMAEVERLLLLYETAMKVDDFVHMVATRARDHALELGGRAGHVEAFHATRPDRFRALVRAAPDDRAAGARDEGAIPGA